MNISNDNFFRLHVNIEEPPIDNGEFLFKITIIPIMILSVVISFHLNLFYACIFLTIINYNIDYIIWFYKTNFNNNTNAPIYINSFIYVYLFLLYFICAEQSKRAIILYIIFLVLFTVKMILFGNDVINIINIPFNVYIIVPNVMFLILIFVEIILTF